MFSEPDSRDDAHARGLATGLIIWGDPLELRGLGQSIRGVGQIHKQKGVLPKTGLIIWGDPLEKTGFRSILGSKKLTMGGRPSGGRVSAATWTAMDGTELTLAFSSGIDLGDLDALVAPAGEWSDLTLTFDGALELDGDVDGVPFGFTADLDTWTMPFETPLVSDGSAEVVLSLELTDTLVGEVLAQDGLIVEPGDALYDEVLRALLDNTFARAR